jgi:hypothetical protein
MHSQTKRANAWKTFLSIKPHATCHQAKPGSPSLTQIEKEAMLYKHLETLLGIAPA